MEPSAGRRSGGEECREGERVRCGVGGGRGEKIPQSSKKLARPTKMMKSTRPNTVLFLLTILMLGVFLNVGAARMLPGDYTIPGSADGSNTKNGLPTYYNAAYETATQNLAFWLQRLSSGPSSGGGGH
ncbi:hypothetical protein Drorol1_Dr00002520 [Drosera rotundifolia]